ncbi:MAG: hypothetical protein QOE51_1169 [Actinoplanes sp.]|nr:hypothetical protein [Actinoplanes sp.]
MRIHRPVLAVVLAASVLVPAGTAGVAWASSSKPVAANPSHPARAAKPAKPVKVLFTAQGRLRAVSLATGTLTVLATGGTKDVRGHVVTITVPSSVRIVRGRAAKLADLRAGDRITVTGSRIADAYTAARIDARAAHPTTTPTALPSTSPTPTTSTEPSESPSTEPSEDHSTEPSESPSFEPSEDPSVEPSEDPSGDPSVTPTPDPSLLAGDA